MPTAAGGCRGAHERIQARLLRGQGEIGLVGSGHAQAALEGEVHAGRPAARVHRHPAVTRPRDPSLQRAEALVPQEHARRAEVSFDARVGQRPLQQHRARDASGQAQGGSPRGTRAPTSSPSAWARPS